MRLNRIRPALIVALLAMVALAGCDISFIFPGPWPEPTADFDLEVSVSWKTVADVDLYVTYPFPADDRNPVDNTGTPVYSDIALAYNPGVSAGDPGFFPQDGTSQREKVYSAWQESTLSSRRDSWLAAVELVEKSSSSLRRETAWVRDLPFNYAGLSFNTTSTSANRLPSGATYAWLGVMEVYVYGVSAKLATVSDGGADAVVTVRNSAGTTIAEFTLPKYTDLDGISIAKVLLFRAKDAFSEYNFYQILPNAQLITSTTQIRSVAGDAGDGSLDVINVGGRNDEGL